MDGIGNKINSNYYGSHISTGKRINSAADDAAGSAIAQKLTSSANGLHQETNNAQDSQNMHKTAEGGLASVQDGLTRMRDLALHASNSFLTDNDKKNIQTEVDQIKQGIADTLNGTQFNTKNVLNQGDSSSALDSLGIGDFDVTGNFDVGSIDHALDNVSSQMSDHGAVMNKLDYTITSNEVAETNQLNAKSRVEDLDFGDAVSDKKKGDILDQVGMFMQKDKMNRDGALVNMMF